MALCDKKITKGIKFSCDLTGGVEAVLYLFNRDDIASYVRSEDNTQIIEDFVMAQVAAGPPAVFAKGFKFEGFNTSVKPKTDGVKKTYNYRYNHQIDFVIFERSASAKEQIESMGRGKFVAVVENLSKTGDSTFEVYGIGVGLTLNTMTDDPTNADTDGAYVLQLASPDDFKEPHMPASFFDTDYATTKANLLALIAANV